MPAPLIIVSPSKSKASIGRRSILDAGGIYAFAELNSPAHLSKAADAGRFFRAGQRARYRVAGLRMARHCRVAHTASSFSCFHARRDTCAFVA